MKNEKEEKPKLKPTLEQIECMTCEYAEDKECYRRGSDGKCANADWSFAEQPIENNQSAQAKTDQKRAKSRANRGRAKK